MPLTHRAPTTAFPVCSQTARTRRAPSSRPRATAWLASFAVLVATAFALTAPAFAEAPARFMQRVADELIAAQRTGTQDAYINVIRKHADVPSIGLYSLGSYARGLQKSDRSTYYDGMVRFIARYAAKEGPKYPVARAVVIGQSGENQYGVYVDSNVALRDGGSYDVRWFLIRRGSGWKVRDAEVVGFWMSPFLKNLFENYISENGGNPKALILALNRQ